MSLSQSQSQSARVACTRAINSKTLTDFVWRARRKKSISTAAVVAAAVVAAADAAAAQSPSLPTTVPVAPMAASSSETAAVVAFVHTSTQSAVSALFSSLLSQRAWHNG